MASSTNTTRNWDNDEFTTSMKKIENGIKSGYDKDTNTWIPHSSLEGGSNTIGYGHKLTPDEVKSGKIEIGGVEYDYANGIPDDKIDELLKVDKEKAYTRAKDLIPGIDSLSQSRQEAIINMSFRGSLGGSPKTVKLINKGKWEEASKEFLDNDEYKNASKGIKDRFDANANALVGEKIINKSDGEHSEGMIVDGKVVDTEGTEDTKVNNTKVNDTTSDEGEFVNSGQNRELLEDASVNTERENLQKKDQENKEYKEEQDDLYNIMENQSDESDRSEYGKEYDFKDYMMNPENQFGEDGTRGIDAVNKTKNEQINQINPTDIGINDSAGTTNQEGIDKFHQDMLYEEIKATNNEGTAALELEVNTMIDNEIATSDIDTSQLKTTPKSVDTASLGNTVGLASQALGNIGSLMTTIDSREIKKENSFANYATDALSKMAEMESMAGSMRDMQMQNLALSKNTARDNNRNTARGINSQRALDMGVYTGGMQQQRAIDIGHQEQLMNIAGQEAGMLLDRDRNVMGGQERTDALNQANRDNYLSNLSQDFQNFGAMGQQYAKNQNQIQSDATAARLISEGKYGNYYDYFLNQ